MQDSNLNQVVQGHLERARIEVGSFEQMRQSAGAVAGLLELLSHTLQSYDSGHTDFINWRAVIGAIEVGSRDVAQVYSASCQLADLEGLMAVLEREAAERGK